MTHDAQDLTERVNRFLAELERHQSELPAAVIWRGLDLVAMINRRTSFPEDERKALRPLPIRDPGSLLGHPRHRVEMEPAELTTN